MKIPKLCLALILVNLMSCHSSKEAPDNQGYLKLSFIENQSFNPDIEQGQIDKFKITISGEDLPSTIVNYFPYDTDNAHFDGLTAGSSVDVMVEAINYNGYVVRRGYSPTINIGAGTTQTAQISINNVPIFANVKDGASVDINRFVPKIFAPGGLEFELVDDINNQEISLQDEISGDVTFSISDADTDATQPIFIPFLSPGTHQLKVRDVNTGESTIISINAREASTKPALMTTAGGYLGSIMSTDIYKPSNMPYYFSLVTE